MKGEEEGGRIKVQERNQIVKERRERKEDRVMKGKKRRGEKENREEMKRRQRRAKHLIGVPSRPAASSAAYTDSVSCFTSQCSSIALLYIRFLLTHQRPNQKVLPALQCSVNITYQQLIGSDSTQPYTCRHSFQQHA